MKSLGFTLKLHQDKLSRRVAMVSHLKLSIQYINISAQIENSDLIWKELCTLDFSYCLLFYFYVLLPSTTLIRYGDVSQFSKLFML